MHPTLLSAAFRLLSHAALLIAVLLPSPCRSQPFELTIPGPSMDRWMYPHNATPGTRPTAPIFGTLGDESGVDSRHGQFLIGFDLAGLVTTNLGPGRYLIRRARLSATVSRDRSFAIDPTPDAVSSFLRSDHPDFAPDLDSGRPVELFGVGFRNGYSAASFSEDGPFGPVAAGQRNAFAAGYDPGGLLVDVGNNVGKTSAAFPVFEAHPFAIGDSTTVQPGELVPAGTTIGFEFNLSDPFVRQYLQEACRSGLLRLMLTSLQTSGFGGAPAWAEFRTRGSFLPAFRLVRRACSMNRPPRHRRPSAGFTLIELLVVVAIIAILASLLLPASLLLALLWGACASSHRPAMTTASEPPASNLAPMPEAVTSFGAVAHDGWLYVCGGHKGDRHEYSAHMVSGAFHRLRLAQGAAWEALPGTDPAQGAPLAAHGRHIYRVGGMAARNQPGEKGDLHSHAAVGRYDIHRGAWEAFVPLPEPRSSHDAVVLGDTLYVGGGWTLAGASGKAIWRDTILKLDLRSTRPRWETIPQPFQRRALAIAGLGDRLYFLGGMSAAGDTLLAVDILETRNGSWSKGPDLPPGPMKGFGCSAIAQNGRIYVSGMKGELHQLDASATHWTLAGKLEHPRFFHRLVPAGTAQLVAAGGEDSEGKRSDLEVLTPSIPERDVAQTRTQ